MGNKHGLLEQERTDLIRQRHLVQISQHELAQQAGVKFSRVHWWESGRIELTPDELKCIKRVLRRAAAETMAEIAEIVAAQ